MTVGSMQQVVGPDGTYPHKITNSGLDAAGLHQQVLTVGLVAVAVPAAPLANRAALVIQACYSNTKKIYIGGATVTADEAATGGIALAPGQIWPLQLNANAIIYAISDAANQKIAIIEVDNTYP